MFGWFSPRCPLDTWEKTWTETRMRWLTDSFGVERLQQAEVIGPDHVLFSEPFEGTKADARQLLDRLCQVMWIDPDSIELEVVADVQMPNAAGQYQRRSQRKRALVRVAESQLQARFVLTATISHELSHELLLGPGALDENTTDHEWITDLVPVFLGLGIFTANATIREQSTSHGHVSWWFMRRQGYLPSRMLGYALALFAYVRGEHSPAWGKHLRLDAATALRDGLRYLIKTGDSLFHPDTLRHPRRPLTPADAVARLRTGSPSVRLTTLWEIQEHRLTGPEYREAVIERLQDRDPAVAGEAARTLPLFGAACAKVIPTLCRMLSAEDNDTRVGAIYALGALRLEPELALEALCGLVGSPGRMTSYAAAWAVSRFQVPADPLTAKRLLTDLETAIIECDYPLVDMLAQAILAVVPDAEEQVKAHFEARDEEMKQHALQALTEQRESPTPLDVPLGSMWGKPL